MVATIPRKKMIWPTGTSPAISLVMVSPAVKLAIAKIMTRPAFRAVGAAEVVVTDMEGSDLPRPDCDAGKGVRGRAALRCRLACRSRQC